MLNLTHCVNLLAVLWVYDLDFDFILLKLIYLSLRITGKKCIIPVLTSLIFVLPTAEKVIQIENKLSVTFRQNILSSLSAIYTSKGTRKINMSKLFMFPIEVSVCFDLMKSLNSFSSAGCVL